MSIGITYQGKLPALSGFKHADKITHAIYGGVITAGSAFIAYKLGLNPATSALAVSAVIATAKEYYDKNYRNKAFDNVDLLATMVPSLLYFIVKLF